MVIRLTLPVIDVDAYIDSVVNERKGGRNAGFYNGFRNDWKDITRAYIAHMGDPSVIQPWAIPENKKDSFRNLYNNRRPDSTHGPIIDALNDRRLQYCPACGEDGTPNTLDHYLPKGRYPEYSITPENLAPMCDICQGHKLEQTVDGLNQRIFLHPYFDAFIDHQAIQLEIHEPFSAPALMLLRPHVALDPDSSALVARHLKHLDMHVRYQKFLTFEYVRLLRNVKRIRSRGKDVVGQLEEFKDNAEMKSVNSWGYVLYEGILSNGALMEYLMAGELGEYL